ncbi:MAG: alpha/beta fold hydrolase [Anaerolineales bacterium]|nr:alpha/beta fold hydrolase [Anaerolineales bacterium]
MSGAGLEGALIPVGEEQLLGGFYRAAGDAPAPAVALLHGIPGHELNLDLAQVLRGAGFHCLYFHYRGSWGSDGTYRMDRLVPDTLAALDWLAQRQDVDSERIALVGISLGGWAALATAARPSTVRVVCALSPLIDPTERPLEAEMANEFARSLDGTTGDKLQQEWLDLTPITAYTAQLVDTSILLVSGDQDEYFSPAHFRPLDEALADLRWVRFPTADHVFSQVRPGLCHLVRGFLLETLRTE